MGAPTPYLPEVKNQVDVQSADVVVCVNSETEIETALACSRYKKRGLTINAALNCIHRCMFRMILSGHALNVPFRPITIKPDEVLKMATSVHNSGVHYLTPDTYTDSYNALKSYFPELATIGVVESYLKGKRYELSGYVLGGVFEPKIALRQEWDPKYQMIVAYHEVNTNFLPLSLIETALCRLGLNDSFFNAELIQHEGQWKLIEVNPRLGEDPRLTQDSLYYIVQDFAVAYKNEKCRI